MWNKVHFSSKRGDWKTPKELFRWLDNQFHFTLDPCTTKDNPLGTPMFYTKEDDGVSLMWNGQRVFVNPPYGREIRKWVEHAYMEVDRKKYAAELVVMLLPARTDTLWFHDYCIYGEIWFLRGRLKFDDQKNSAPFPSMIVIFRKGLK